MPFWRIVPPLPHPYWAQSVAPAGWQGRVPRQSRPPLPPRRGCRPHPSRAPSPQGVGSQPKWLHTTNAPPFIVPCRLPSCSGVPRQEQWRTEPPLPLPARPPPLKGWISYPFTYENLKVVGGSGYNWVHTIISIFDAPNPELAALEPLHRKLRGEV